MNGRGEVPDDQGLPPSLRRYPWLTQPNVMTEEMRKAKIDALLEERRAYQIKGDDDRVAQVDAELRRLGSEGAPPVKRAAKRENSV